MKRDIVVAHAVSIVPRTLLQEHLLELPELTSEVIRQAILVLFHDWFHGVFHRER